MAKSKKETQPTYSQHTSDDIYEQAKKKYASDSAAKKQQQEEEYRTRDEIYNAALNNFRASQKQTAPYATNQMVSTIDSQRTGILSGINKGYSEFNSDLLGADIDRYRANLSRMRLAGYNSKDVDDMLAEAKYFEYATGKRKDFYSQFSDADEYARFEQEAKQNDPNYRKETYDANVSRLNELQQKERMGLLTDKEKTELETIQASVNQYDRFYSAQDQAYFGTRNTDYAQNIKRGSYNASDLDTYNKNAKRISELTSKGTLSPEEQSELERIQKWNADYDDYTHEIESYSDQYGVPYDTAYSDRLGTWSAANDQTKQYIMNNVSGDRNLLAFNEEEIWNGGNGTYSKIISDGEANHWDMLESHEVDYYYYLMNTQGADAANAWLDSMSITLGKRDNDRMSETISNASTLQKISYNAFSLMSSPIANAMAFTTTYGQGDNYNPYDLAHNQQNWNQATTGATSQAIDNATGGKQFLGVSFGDVYSALTSSAESRIGSLIFGPTYTVTMGLGSAASTAKELYERGASEDQIVLQSTLAGTWETFFEYCSAEIFLNKILGNKVGKNIVENIFLTLGKSAINGLSEGSEEFFTELANIVTDRNIMGSQSEFNVGVNQLMQQENLSYKEAAGKYVADKLWSAFAGGYISGAVGGVAAGVSDTINTYDQTVSRGQSIIEQNNYNALQSMAQNVAGQAMPEYNFLGDNNVRNAQKDVQRSARRADKNQSPYRVGQLANAIDRATDAYSVEQIARDLTRNGYGRFDGSPNGVSGRIKSNLRYNSVMRVANWLYSVYNDGADLIDTIADDMDIPTDIAKQIAARLKLNTLSNDPAFQSTYGNLFGVGKNGNMNGYLNERIQKYGKVQGNMDSMQEEKPVVETKPVENDIVDETTGEETADTPIDTQSLVEEGIITPEQAQEIDAVLDTVPAENAEEPAAQKEEQKQEEPAPVEESKPEPEKKQITKLTDKQYADSYKIDEDTAKAFSELFNGSTQNEYDSFLSGMASMFSYGKANVPVNAIRSNPDINGLSEEQKKYAWNTGRHNGITETESREKSVQDSIEANKKNASDRSWKKGTVKSKGVSLTELKETFNDKQNQIYKMLSFLAEATGIDIVIFNSGTQDKATNVSGAFLSKTNEIYIDINSGILSAKSVGDFSKYTALRTFTHEFVHFVEKWSPKAYNELSEAVIKYASQNGVNIEDEIDKINSSKVYDKLTKEKATREVIAESLTDILPDSKFISNLADNHKTVFEKMRDKLAEFIENIKSYFKTLAPSRNAVISKLQDENGKYLQEIVDAFDKAAESAVWNYQRSVFEMTEEQNENVKEEGKTQESPKQETNNQASETEELHDGYTITSGSKSGFMQVRFNEKPSQDIIDAIKKIGMKWSSRNKVWYGKVTSDQIVSAINSVKTSSESESETIEEASVTQSESNVVNGSSEETAKSETEEPIETVTGQEESSINDISEKENSNDGSAEVSTPVADGERTPRLVERESERPVQEPESTGNTVDNTGEDAGESGRDSGGMLEERNEPSASERGSESGVSGTTVEEKPEIEEEQEESVEEPERKPVEEIVEENKKQQQVDPKGTNYTFPEGFDFPKGADARYEANVAAIRLIQKLREENRKATEEEQSVLARYSGWGGVDRNKLFGWRPEGVWGERQKELKELLGDSLYRDAMKTTDNAFYTSIPIIRAMYKGLEHLGFNGGRVIEPSCGVGNFIGAMPNNIANKITSLTMVELDPTTAEIAKYLYPHANVINDGYQNVMIPDNFLDVAIGNVPFSASQADNVTKATNYPAKLRVLHNYFFAKTIDKVRPGGIVMFITSASTMDSEDSGARKYLAARADLIGAIRLNNKAFSDVGTNVVSDILIFKKREANTPYTGEAFTESKSRTVKMSEYYEVGVFQNEYFDNHPEMVLGVSKPVSSRFGGYNFTYDPMEGDIAEQIEKAMKSISSKMEYPERKTPEQGNEEVIKGTKKGHGQNRVRIDENGNKVTTDREGNITTEKVDKELSERISGISEIRDAVWDLLNMQQSGASEEDIALAMAKLNKLYDDFVSKYGKLNDRKNFRAFNDDDDIYLIQSLEKADGTKADIFSKRVVQKNVTVESVDNIFDAVTVSINTTGVIDVAKIASLTGKTAKQVENEIVENGLGYKDGTGTIVPAETYLSGNVRAKLREAEMLAQGDKSYERNVEALKKVAPKDLSAAELNVDVGAPWVPEEYYEKYFLDYLGYTYNNVSENWRGDVRRAISITYESATDSWKVEIDEKEFKYNQKYRESKISKAMNFKKIVELALIGREPVVKAKDSTGKTYVLEVETKQAQMIWRELRNGFTEWIGKDLDRAKVICDIYNNSFNAYVAPQYNGSGLTVNGMKFSLYPHQANAVQRIIQSGGNTLLAHKVGAGKTLEMSAAAMKMKELGIIKKPMFVVPKSLVGQWAKEFRDYFPGAKILYPGENDFNATNRKAFAGRITTGDWDAVIVSYENFERLPIDYEFQIKMLEEQLREAEEAYNAEISDSGKKFNVNALNSLIEKTKKKIESLTEKAGKDDGSVFFNQLGVDGLFVDEAHNFKNLFYVSRMSQISGMGNQEGSGRAYDLYAKTRWLQSMNGGRGIVFATATPIMNSVVEAYTMQRYLQPDLMKQLNISGFDLWCKQFGVVQSENALSADGVSYKVKTSLKNIKNVPEFQSLFRSFADVLTDIPGLKIPKLMNGKPTIIECAPSEFQKEYMKELGQRALAVKNGSVEPSEDNNLKISSDGRKVSYSQRMIDPSLPYETGGKIFRCAEEVAKRFKETAKAKGTQIVFLDASTPKDSAKSTGKSKKKSTVQESETNDDSESVAIAESVDEESAKLYQDLRDRMISLGIPAKEIAFIHDAKTVDARLKLFEAMNNGTIRVLIGSTSKMGVGMNAQKRVVAIHHIDATWRPGDIEQRNGRGIRQHNMNPEVEIVTYVTKGTYDTFMWDKINTKQKFINKIMNGESVGRTVEDLGSAALSAEELVAISSGDPRIKQKMDLEKKIDDIELEETAFKKKQTKAREDIQSIRLSINKETARKATFENALKGRTDDYKDNDHLSISISNQTITDKKMADAAITTAMYQAEKNLHFGQTQKIGRYSGVDLIAKKTDGISLDVGGVSVLSPTLQKIKNALGSFEKNIKDITAVVENLKKVIADNESTLSEKFAKQGELDRARIEYAELMAELMPDESSQILVGEDEDADYAARTEALSDRDLLEMASKNVIVSELTEAEKNALNMFQSKLSVLEQLQEKRVELGREYKRLMFTKGSVNREEASRVRANMKTMDAQIERASAEVLKVEESAVLKRVLQEARKIVTDQEREKGKAALAKYREKIIENASMRKYKARITEDIVDLAKWITNPGNKEAVRRVPDFMKNEIIPFVMSIDISSKRSLNGGQKTKADISWSKQLQKLRDAIDENVSVEGLYSGYNDLPKDFMDNLKALQKAAEGFQFDTKQVINKMSEEDLKKLSKLIRNLKHWVKGVNAFHANSVYAHVTDAGNDAITYLKGISKRADKSAFADKSENFLMWQNIRPAYAFERFGEGGKAIYKSFVDGQAKLAFHANEIIDFTSKLYSESEINSWNEQVLNIKLSDGSKVAMPVTAAMSLYELYKRPQAQTHIDGEGIRIASYDNGKAIVSDVGHKVTPEDLYKIFSKLTKRQKEVADKLQQYMATKGAEWGNYVTVKRFGERQFGESTYFPINSDGQHIEANADEKLSAASLYALLNMSFTNELKENASNRIVLFNIFDVFANHMASMAQYNAFALPVLDAVKWFNYKQVEEEKDAAGFVVNREVKASVREEMNRVYGTPVESRPGSGRKGYAETFFMNVVKAFNGTEAQGSAYDETGLNWLRTYNLAQVAYNARVVVQQPLSIIRAGMYLDYDTIMQGIGMTVEQLKDTVEEMKKINGIAAWKLLGFYDVNVSRGLTDTIKHSNTLMDKITEVGMAGAEAADTVTWAAMWNAAKSQISKTGKYKYGSDEYWDAVNNLYNEVIYKTQVVDSVLTKPEYLRSKGFFARATGSFMSEPLTTASMLLNAYEKYKMDMQRGFSRSEAWMRNKANIGRTSAVFALSSFILAAVQGIADAWRDDDDYQTFFEKWKEAFTGNFIDELSPIEKLPILREFWNLGKDLLNSWGVDTYGNDPTTVLMQWKSALVSGSDILADKILGKKTNYTWYAVIYKMLQTVSGISGIPVAAGMREVASVWNNTVGAFDNKLKLKTYVSGSEIKYAFNDGYLTEEEAINELLKQGKADDANDAYWQVRSWAGGSDYHKYDSLYGAIDSGADLASVLNMYMEHGTEIKTLKSQITEHYKPLYINATVYERQNMARLIINAYIAMGSTAEEAEKKMASWLK